MSQKSKVNRARRAAKEEKQAKNVVTWIFCALILLGVIFAIYTLTLS